MVAEAWPALVELAGAASAIPFDRLCFSPTLEAAVADADLVQENGPETLAFKREIYARLDTLTGPGTIIASKLVRHPDGRHPGGMWGAP